MTDGVALLPAKAGGGEMVGAWGVNSVNCVDALALLAGLEGRRYIGCDREPKWAQAAQNRCASAFGERRRVVSEPVAELPLFAGNDAA